MSEYTTLFWEQDVNSIDPRMKLKSTDRVSRVDVREMLVSAPGYSLQEINDARCSLEAFWEKISQLFDRGGFYLQSGSVFTGAVNPALLQRISQRQLEHWGIALKRCGSNVPLHEFISAAARLDHPIDSKEGLVILDKTAKDKLTWSGYGLYPKSNFSRYMTAFKSNLLFEAGLKSILQNIFETSDTPFLLHPRTAYNAVLTDILPRTQTTRPPVI